MAFNFRNAVTNLASSIDGYTYTENTLDVAELRIKTALLTNQQLISEYKKCFQELGGQTYTDIEKPFFYDITKTYIDEFRTRITKYKKSYDFSSLRELGILLQNIMKDHTQSGYEFLINNTIRLYAITIKALKITNDKKLIKGDFQ